MVKLYALLQINQEDRDIVELEKKSTGKAAIVQALHVVGELGKTSLK